MKAWGGEIVVSSETGRSSLRYLLLAVFILSCAPVLRAQPEGNPPPPPDCTKAKQNIERARRFFSSVPFGIGKAAESVLVTDPENQLRPGDILVYPFQKRHATEGNAPKGEPDAYRAALQGYGHAAIVARSPEGKLYHLDSQQMPQDMAEDFGGKAAYYVVRPKTPSGMKREEFESAISKAANCFARIGYEYDPLMKMEYMSQTELDKMKKFVADCPEKREPGQPSPIPPQFCSELTQTVLAVAGGKTAQPSSSGHLIDLAIARVKRGEIGDLQGKALEAKVEEAVGEVILMFTFGMKQARDDMKGFKTKLKSQLAEAEAKGESTKGIEEELKGLEAQLTGIERELSTYEMGRALLTTIAMARINGVDASLMKGMTSQPIVRPYDVLGEALSARGNFTFARFYPGHIPGCEYLRPEGPPGEPSEPQREVAGHR